MQAAHKVRVPGVVWCLATLLAGVLTATATPSSPAGSMPMDEPLRLLERAQKAFRGVRDYACDFIKRERIRGELQPHQFMRMKVRTEPFSVHLKWELPKAMAGQEACYVEGKNNGMMRVRPNRGLVSLVGWVSLAPDDLRAMKDSRHTIKEAGLGNLLERFGRGWEEERRLNRTEVKVAMYEYAGRRCRRVETKHPAGSGQFKFYRSVLYFDTEHGLPVRVENYDWPKQDGDTAGELLEVYSYIELRTNVGLTDAAFAY